MSERRIASHAHRQIALLTCDLIGSSQRGRFPKPFTICHVRVGQEQRDGDQEIDIFISPHHNCDRGPSWDCLSSNMPTAAFQTYSAPDRRS
eukprot:2223691-Rhodomonas_salina.1